MNYYNKINYLNTITNIESIVIKDNYLNTVSTLLKDEMYYLYISNFFNADGILKSEVIKSFLNDFLMFIKDECFDNNIYKKMYLFKRKYSLDLQLLFNERHQETINEIYKSLKINLDKIIFESYIKTYQEKSLIYLDNLLLIYTLNLEVKKHTFILNKLTYNSTELIYNLGIDSYLINSSLEVPKSVLITANKKDYLTNNKTIIDLRILYKDHSYIPTFDVVEEFLINNLSKSKENYVIFPLFLKGESTILKSNNHGYFRIYYEFKNFYDRLSELLIKMMNTYKVIIIIPNTMNLTVYKKWELYLKSSFSEIKVGLLVDDFDIVNDFNEYSNFDGLIIDLDYINNNNFDNELLSKEYFNDNYLDSLRELKAVLLSKTDNYIISSKYMNNSEIIEKMVIIGYKNFYFDVKKLPFLQKTLENYYNRRGKYIKKSI